MPRTETFCWLKYLAEIFMRDDEAASEFHCWKFILPNRVPNEEHSHAEIGGSVSYAQTTRR